VNDDLHVDFEAQRKSQLAKKATMGNDVDHVWQQGKKRTRPFSFVITHLLWVHKPFQKNR